MLVAAYVFQFLDFIAHSFVISAQEFAYRDNDVDFIGSGVECHCGFGNFHFREGLRRGETTRNAGYLYIVRLQRAVYDFRHVGVDADGSYVFQVGIFVYKFINLFGETHHAFLAVGTFQRGQINAVEKEFLYLLRIVFLHVFVEKIRRFRSDFIVMECRIVFAERKFILVGLSEVFAVFFVIFHILFQFRVVFMSFLVS